MACWLPRFGYCLVAMGKLPWVFVVVLWVDCCVPLGGHYKLLYRGCYEPVAILLTAVGWFLWVGRFRLVVLGGLL